MASILQPECNFLHGYFRCLLPVEVVHVEVKITSMQGTHIFRRDRTTQLIKCTLWSSRLCPHPTIIRKMRTFLDIEGKPGPISQSSSNHYRSPQLDTNPNVRKVNKAAEKRKRVAPTKRFRANIAAKPNEAATCPPITVSKTSIEETPDNRPPPLEDAPICKSTPWPEAGKISGNLFEERKDWLLPPNYLDTNAKGTTSVTSPKPPIKEEPKAEEQPSTSPKAEKCAWGPNCPFCKHQEEEDWDGDYPKQLQQQPQPQQNVQITQAKCLQTLNYQKPQSSQKFDQKTSDGQYPSQLEIHKQWEAEMERLNAKYNLDSF